MRWLSRLLGTIGLAVVYVFVVVPIAWLSRMCGTTFLVTQPQPLSPTYWRPLDMDSADRSLYEDGEVPQSAGRTPSRWGAARRFRRQQVDRGGQLKCWVFLATLPWARFTWSPEEPELQSDLYVLF